jgi:hypothetical protein
MAVGSASTRPLTVLVAVAALPVVVVATAAEAAMAVEVAAATVVVREVRVKVESLLKHSLTLMFRIRWWRWSWYARRLTHVFTQS